MTDLRNRIPPSGPFVVDTSSRPIIGTGGDQSQAGDVVPPGTTTTLITLPLDTTGSQIGGAIMTFTTQVELASTAALAKCTFDFLVNDAPPPGTVPIGAIVQADASGAVPVVSVAFSGSFVMLPPGSYTLKVRCTTDANTTATVNPGGTFSRTLLLFFFKV